MLTSTYVCLLSKLICLGVNSKHRSVLAESKSLMKKLNNQRNSLRSSMESTGSTLDPPPAKDIRHISSESDEISCLTSDNNHLGGNTATSAGGRKKWGREGSYAHSGGGETSRPNPEGGVGGAAKAAKKRGIAKELCSDLEKTGAY